MLDCLFIVALLLLTDFQGYNLFSEEAKQTNSFIVQCLFFLLSFSINLQYGTVIITPYQTISLSRGEPVLNYFTVYSRHFNGTVLPVIFIRRYVFKP